MKSKRGAFIVLEGCDRVGKSTQAKKLTEELRKLNIRTASYAFPSELRIILISILYLYL